MVKKIDVSDEQYDWLRARGKFKSTPSRVLEGVINLVKRIEADQEKYKAWTAASIAKGAGKETKGNEKGGENDKTCLDSKAK